jgi:hypothetical protein
MKKLILPLAGMVFMMSFSGCGLMEDAFKTGIFFGILIIAIIGLIIWLLRIVIKQLRKKFEWEIIK